MLDSPLKKPTEDLPESTTETLTSDQQAILDLVELPKSSPITLLREDLHALALTLLKASPLKVAAIQNLPKSVYEYLYNIHPACEKILLKLSENPSIPRELAIKLLNSTYKWVRVYVLKYNLDKIPYEKISEILASDDKDQAELIKAILTNTTDSHLLHKYLSSQLEKNGITAPFITEALENKAISAESLDLVADKLIEAIREEDEFHSDTLSNVIRNPLTSSQKLLEIYELYKEKSEGGVSPIWGDNITADCVRNINLPSTILEEISGYAGEVEGEPQFVNDEDIAKHAFQHRNLPRKVIDAALRSENDQFLRILATNPSLTVEDIKHLIEQGNAERYQKGYAEHSCREKLHCNIAGNEGVDNETAQMLLNAGTYMKAIKNLLRRKRQIDPEILERMLNKDFELLTLIRDTHPTRFVVAERDLKEGMYLTAHPRFDFFDYDFYELFTKRKEATPEQLLKITRLILQHNPDFSCPHVTRNIIDHPNTPEEAIKLLNEYFLRKLSTIDVSPQNEVNWLKKIKAREQKAN